jgi:hydrogenase/urease accessory protein HupE
MQNFSMFLGLGFNHIMEGYDHLLFLLGLVIVSRDWRSLLRVISAFTIAHSTTLVLSALGIVSLPPILTETLIAASIVYVGIENVVRRGGGGRWVVAGLFGLVHGAGFSGHLTGLLKSVLGMGSMWPSLIGFNVGIELGQIAVIAIVFPLLYLVRRKGKEELIVSELSRAIAAVGAVLIVWRLWGIGA